MFYKLARCTKISNKYFIQKIVFYQQDTEVIYISMLKMVCFRIKKKNDGFCRCSYMYNCINNNYMVFRKDTDLSFV